MESGRITAWCVASGEEFTRGQVLLEVETDKTIVEVPALQQGKLTRIIADVGEQVTVGAAIAQIELEGEAPVSVTEDPSTGTHATATNSTVTTASNVAVAGSADFVSRSKTENVGINPANESSKQPSFATPRARRMARQFGIDLTTVTGTGRRQRITFADVVGSVAPATAQRTVQEPLQSSLIVSTTDTIETSTGDIHRTHWRMSDTSITRVVVLLHGLFGDARSWAEIATRVLGKDSSFGASGFSVCAIDLPGHGDSSCSAASLDQVCISIIKSLEDFEEIVLVGHSYGGLIVSRISAHFKDRLVGLVLLAPAGLGREIDQKFLDTMANPDSDASQLCYVMNRLTANGDESLTAYIDALHKRNKPNAMQLASLIDHFAVEGQQLQACNADLELLACPLTIVWGDRTILLTGVMYGQRRKMPL